MCFFSLHLILTFPPFFRALASLIIRCLFSITALLLVCVSDGSRSEGVSSWTVPVELKDVWVASLRRENPMSVLVRVTLINHILSPGCVED